MIIDRSRDDAAASSSSPEARLTQDKPSARAWYVLGAILLVSTFNFIDRIIVGVVQEPMKAEFQLSDFQLGLLGGPAFAVLYVIMGFPFARLAERTNRASLIAGVVGLWSVMTALCGLTTNYLQLLAARVGVSVGEAGGAPASQSLISDYFPPRSRALAFGIYSLGVPLGSLLAALAGGWLASSLGWRATFIALGVAGCVLALVFRLTVREPLRTGAPDVPPLFQTVKFLLGKRTFRQVMAGNTVALFTVYTLQQYLVSYFIRRHGFDLGHAALILGLVAGLSGGIGTFLGGFLAGKLATRYERVLSWLPAIGFIVAWPLYTFAFLSTNVGLSIALLMVASIFHFLYLGPSYAMTQGVAHPRMRATATATLLFAVNLLGAGLGPPIMGALSDHIGGLLVAGGPTAVRLCSAGFCDQGAGLPLAMAIFSLGNLWAAFHFLRAGTRLKAETLNEQSPTWSHIPNLKPETLP